jgi:alpha-glucosidase
MRDIKLKRSEILDPVGKHYWPFYIGRDGCRSPMQWDGNENAGFGEGKPWLKVHPNYLQRNVEAQESDPNSLLNFFKRLLRVRKESPVLRRGAFVPLTDAPKHILAYLRESQTHTALVVLNFRDGKIEIPLNAELRGKQWQLLLSSKRRQTPDITDGILPVDGNEASIYITDKKSED